MNAHDILKTWPGIADASADDLFGHPAWAMPCQWGDERCFLRKSAKPRDVIGLAVTLDEDVHFLGIGNREAFPDLHDLWGRKSELPPALVLALVEKECGDLLQLVENVLRRQVRVVGLDDPGKRASAFAFEVVSAADGNIRSSFVLDVRPSSVRTFGQLRFLDAGHESIRSMERNARVVYATFDLPAGDVDSLAAGDFLMLPELESGASGEWMCDMPEDGRLRAVSAIEQRISFASFADGILPRPPAPAALELFRGRDRIACGRFGALCSKPAFEIEEVL